MFIGYFNLANSVTLLGLVSSVMAIFCASQGVQDEKMFKLAIVMFLFAGLCDMFDGKIARGSGARQRREKIYGIQLDSLADVVSFGVVPTLIVYNMGYGKGEYDWIDLIIYLIFIICGATRLAYFNTQALSDTPDLNMKYFTGLPIPFSCVALPVLVLLTTIIKDFGVTQWLFRIFFLFTGIAYVLRIKIKKFSMKTLLVVCVFEIICIVLLLLSKAFYIPVFFNV